MRLLVDGGAHTAAVRLMNSDGVMVFNGTPLDLAICMLREKKIDGNDATEEQLHRLERIRRLLLQVEAVHAVSLLWPVSTPSMIRTAEGTSRTVVASTPLKMMLPILRRRARRRRMLLAALLRWVV